MIADPDLPIHPYPRVREALHTLTKEVQRGDAISVEQAEANLAFAVQMRDDPNFKDRRGKLRAVELIEAMRTRGFNIAMYLDKMDRVDHGLATESVDHVHTMTIKPPRVLGAIDRETV